MGFKGIHLTDLGEPIGIGEIRLLRGDTLLPLRPHAQLQLYDVAYDQTERVAFSDSHHSAAKDTGLYPAKKSNKDRDIEFILPVTCSHFIRERLISAPMGEQTLTVTMNEATEHASARDGIVYLHQEIIRKLIIHSISIIISRVSEGVGISVRANLSNRGIQGDDNTMQHDKEPVGALYSIELDCLINNETRQFRYEHRVGQQTSRPGLRRAYAGDEVQTSLSDMSLTHPIIYNTGGTYALSREGTHRIEIDAEGARIQPVTLSGWGWGSVYGNDAQSGRSELTIPWLTRDLIQVTLSQLGHWNEKEDRLAASIMRSEGELGFFVEAIDQSSGQRLNERKIERITMQFTVDSYGMTISIDAQLSSILPSTRNDNFSPAHDNTYKKTLLVPWETLIMRGFNMQAYLSKRP